MNRRTFMKASVAVAAVAASGVGLEAPALAKPPLRPNPLGQVEGFSYWAILHIMRGNMDIGRVRHVTVNIRDISTTHTGDLLSSPYDFLVSLKRFKDVVKELEMTNRLTVIRDKQHPLYYMVDSRNPKCRTWVPVVEDELT